jgi:hypothetical protein
MLTPSCFQLTVALIACLATTTLDLAAATNAPVPLKPPSAFNGITDRNARSVAIYNEAKRVIENPRCMNCHTATRIPTQGNDLHQHVPFIRATTGGGGPPGLACAACHGSSNVSTFGASIQSIPGHDHWGLAPESMAWQGKSTAEICSQIKDRTRNGNLSLTKIHDHMAKDKLVGWAWHPGAGRVPAPGTQAAFGQLIKAWIATGAACPTP